MSTFSTVRRFLDLLQSDPNIAPAFQDAVASSDRAPAEFPDAAQRLLRSIVSHWYEFGPEHGLDELIDCADRHYRRAEREASVLTLEQDEQVDQRQLTQEDLDELQRDRDERNGDARTWDRS